MCICCTGGNLISESHHICMNTTACGEKTLMFGRFDAQFMWSVCHRAEVQAGWMWRWRICTECELAHVESVAVVFFNPHC